VTASGITQLQVALDNNGQTTLAATAYVTERRGVVSTTVTYDASYIGAEGSYALSPEIGLVAAQHHVAGLPGSFADSAPDRWGRNLIARRLRAQASQEQRAPASIREVDYLLGVSDTTRQGALRFAIDRSGPYLGAEADVPPLIALPRLLRAADKVANRGEDDYAAVKELLAAGSGSLGGARPKASVRDGERLLIAKFPHRSDEWDVMAWEKTALDLAQRCGIRVPIQRLVSVGEHHVLLLDRFDRKGEVRLGYISAMTLLRSTDGQSNDYLELAEAISEYGGAVKEDLAQLWRRIAFMLVVNSVDDHMRNHGFLHGRGGWVLSPAFDLNPEPEADARRVSTINFVEDADSALAALRASAEHFRLSPVRADTVLREVLDGTQNWSEVARANNVKESEIKRFTPALDRFHR